MKNSIIKNWNALVNLSPYRFLLAACGIALVVALTVSQQQPASANHLEPPDVPDIIQVPAGNHLFRISHAIGTQDYICLSTGWASMAYGPQATLFNDDYRQTATHFLSPNPDESGKPRPTWQDSLDTSSVWANPMPGASYTPDSTAIAWLLLEKVGTAEGPTGGSRLSGTTYIQRVNTVGGLKPSGSCNEGDKALVHYTADYYFYRADDDN